VMIEVSERKFRYYGVGATFSNTEGFGVEGYWGHRNLFGRAESLRIEGSIGRIADTSDYTDMNYSAGVLFEKPGVIGPDSKFFANFKTVLEHPDAYERFSTKAGVGLQYKLSETQTVSAEAAIDYSRIIDAYDVESRHLLVSLPVQYIFDNRDNKLDPTGGFRAMAFVEPTYDIRSGATFVKLKGEGSTYIGLDANDDMVLALRMAGGSLLGAELSDVPIPAAAGRCAATPIRASVRRTPTTSRRVACPSPSSRPKCASASPTPSASCRSSMPARCRTTPFPISPSSRSARASACAT